MLNIAFAGMDILSPAIWILNCFPFSKQSASLLSFATICFTEYPFSTSLSFFLAVCSSCLKIVDSRKLFFYLFARIFFTIAFFRFSFSLSIPEHWNVTTFLGASIISFPVAGFLPRRFFLTQNFPKPEIITWSPDSRDCLMSSSNISMVCFYRLFTGESVSFCHCVNYLGFSEGAG